MDQRFDTFDPKQESCGCGQRFQWYPVISRRAVVVSFQKNLFQFSYRFEYPIPVDGDLKFTCVKCHQPIALKFESQPAPKPERRKTGPVTAGSELLRPESEVKK